MSDMALNLDSGTRAVIGSSTPSRQDVVKRKDKENVNLFLNS